MAATPERHTRPLIDSGGDDADQLRSLVSAMLSGTYRDDSYLWDVASLCHAKPEFGRRLLALIERYNRLGQIPVAQYTQIRQKIEQSLGTSGRAHQRSPDPRERKRQAKQRQRERSGRVPPAQRSGERASTVTAAIAQRASSLPLPAQATTTAPLPASIPAGGETNQAPPPRRTPAQAGTAAAPASVPSSLQPGKPATSAADPVLCPAPAPPPRPAGAPPGKATGSVRPSPAEPPPPKAQKSPARPAPQERPAPRERHLPPAQARPVQQPPAAREAPAQANARPPPLRTDLITDLIIEPGAVLRERYELESLIGCGGMAAVYKALDRHRASLGLPDCHVALKVVAPHSAAPAGDTGLGREFHNAQQLSHPNIVNVFEIDREAGSTFYTMELLEGEQLDALQARLGGPLPRKQALAIVRDIGAAIEHAHSRGVLHADLKPQNVFITFGGQVRILDFGGLSIPAAAGPWISEPPYDAPSGPAERYQTATPAYASCEQLEGQQVDARDDIYALACISYELLTGRHPFDGSSALQARAQHLRPRRPSQLRAGSWRALRRALSWQRAQRPRDIASWLEQLGVGDAPARLPPSYELRAQPTESDWGRWAALAAAVLLCVGAATTFALRGSERLDRQQLLSSALSSLQQTRARVRDRLWHAAPPAPGAGRVPLPSDGSAPVPVPASPMPAATPTPPTDLPPPAKPHAADGVAVAGAGNRTGQLDAAPAGTSAGASRSVSPGASVNAAVASAASPAPERAASSPQPVEFSSTSYAVHDSAPAARVIVRRSGDTQAELRFVWWTQDDTAKADIDYAPLGRRTEHLLPGQDHMTLYVPIISNPLRHATTTFFVALGRPGAAGAPPSARASVTIERGG